MVLALLDQVTITRVLSLFHSRMWKSKYFEVYCQPRSALVARGVARYLRHGKQRVSPFYHDLGLDLVGLIGNFWIVEQLVHLVIEQLANPIVSSRHVPRRSFEEDEVTHILSRKRLLQFPSEQLSEYNKAGSVS